MDIGCVSDQNNETVKYKDVSNSVLWLRPPASLAAFDSCTKPFYPPDITSPDNRGIDDLPSRLQTTVF
jgi:hypothetical protein